jgi:L-alanine-DL-glutamate epimerase-like enolase superfamily enzyme
MEMVPPDRSNPFSFAAAVGALDCALWDAYGRQAQLPTANLVASQYTTSVPCYASFITVDIDGPFTEDIAREAGFLGFWGQKWRLPDGPGEGDAGLKRNICRIERLRNAAGDMVPLLMETGATWTLEYLDVFTKAAAHLDIAWIEEPYPSTDIAAYARLPDLPIPIAAGETCWHLQCLKDLAHTGHLSVLQPDAVQCGGLSVLQDAVKIAYELDLIFAPHGRALLPALHVAATNHHPERTVLEFNLLLEPERQTSMGIRLLPEDGYIRLIENEWNGLWPKDR